MTSVGGLSVNNSGSQGASYAGDNSLDVKRPEREYVHSALPSAEVQNTWSFTATPLYSVARRLMGIFTF
jgi:hypothetical protein